jgi:anti-sigma factor RsiW
MSDDRCAEMRLLVQADLDGELAPFEAARVAVHVDTCPACAALQAELMGLSGRIRQEVPRFTAPDALHRAIADGLGPVPAVARRPRLWALAPFGGGFALAACLALVMLLPRTVGGLTEAVVSDHIRALQPNHLMDVVSTDQHTVKPWFDGRLDFAPPVRDLKAEGFPLEGGRLDYLAGRPVAALIYQRGMHIIDLYVWPESGAAGPGAGSRSGYNFEHWTQGGMTFWAVSDLEAGELAAFVRLVRG